MIKEEYVSFEVAKLLKGEGFDEECHHVYDGENIEWTNILYGEDVLSNSEILDFDVISAPTQQMAMRWLREEKHICIEPYCIDQKFMCGFAKFPECTDIDCHQSYGEYATYEEAVEAAIKYCLENLI